MNKVEQVIVGLITLTCEGEGDWSLSPAPTRSNSSVAQISGSVIKKRTAKKRAVFLSVAVTKETAGVARGVPQNKAIVIIALMYKYRGIKEFIISLNRRMEEEKGLSGLLI